MPNLYYYNEKGEKIGPLTPLALQALVLQGQVIPETILENDQGQQTQARNLKGLTFPAVPFAAQASASVDGKKRSFFVTVIGLLLIAAIAWAGLKIEDAYSEGDSLLSMLKTWIASREKQANEEKESIEDDDKEQPIGREAMEEKIMGDRAAMEKKNREEAEAQEREIRKIEEAERQRQAEEQRRKEAEWKEILAGAADLKAELQKSGFGEFLRDFVQFGSTVLQQRLQDEERKYNRLNAFEKDRDKKAGINSAQAAIDFARKEIAAKTYLCEYPYRIFDLKIDPNDNRSSCTMSVETGFTTPVRSNITFPMVGIAGDFLRNDGGWTSIRFLVSGNKQAIEELMTKENQYRARIRFKNLHAPRQRNGVGFNFFNLQAEVISVEIVKIH